MRHVEKAEALPMTIRRLLRAALVFAPLLGGLAPLLAGAAPARAETGYELWLRYPRVADAARLQEYRAAIAGLVVAGESPTLAAARRELSMGLNGLLGVTLPAGDAAGGNAVVAGTPASSRLIASLPLAAELGPLGGEGYLIRSVEAGGRRLVVIAANRDIGVLYGAFALLRQLQMQRPLAGLALASAPKLEP